MASVFLSYDRDDAAKARSIALALEKAGHSVWWDLHVRGGAQFSKVIEEALKAADAVVVLWSAHSVESAWVRDEAAAGRDSGRLVPVALDGTAPPLGFRQFQTIDFSGWKGRGKPAQLRTLLADVSATTADGPGQQAAIGTVTPRPQSAALPRSLQMSLAILVVAAALSAFLSWRPWATQPSTTVAISAADSSRVSQGYAQDLFAQLGQLQAAKPGGLQLVGANVGKQASLVFEVSGLMEGRRARANLVLLAGRKGALLWSKAFERPIDQVGDLRQELGYTAAQVLECTVEAYSDGRPALRSDALKLYLNGCAELAHGSRDTAALIPLFRRVIGAAPQFEDAWAKLLFAEDYTFMSSLDYSADSPLAHDLKRDIAAARKINPKMAQAYLAEADLLPLNAFGQKLALVDRAIASDPNNPTALASRSGTRFAVGRVSDALDDARLAADLDPISPRARQSYIFALAQAGRTRAALDEIAKAERIWPGSSVIAGSRFAIHLRFGDPRVAWQMIQAGQTEASWIGAENFLKARLSRKTEDIERALKVARTLYQGEPWTFHNLVQTLSILDREDELLALLMSVPVDDATYVTDVTFRPAARELWHNPKSLAYAKRAGLLQYWQSSGEWPDFCRDADLPYDCKAEAAKLT